MNNLEINFHPLISYSYLLIQFLSCKVIKAHNYYITQKKFLPYMSLEYCSALAELKVAIHVHLAESHKLNDTGKWAGFWCQACWETWNKRGPNLNTRCYWSTTSQKGKRCQLSMKDLAVCCFGAKFCSLLISYIKQWRNHYLKVSWNFLHPGLDAQGRSRPPLAWCLLNALH